MSASRPERGPTDDGSDGVRLSVSAVARRLGVAPATLRTWDRRYGIGPSHHDPGTHRRYDQADVERLERMHAALVHGASSAEAARVALGARLAVPTSGPAAELAAAPTEHDEPDDDAPADPRVRAGGSVLRMPGAGRSARGLARAALALDTVATQRALLQATSSIGVVRTWDEVVRPVMGAVSDRWSYTGLGIEVEHLLSEAITSVLSRVQLDAPAPVSARSVLLGTLRGEQHSLPLRALGAALSRRGVSSTLLGPDLPTSSLVSAITRTGPSAVFLWAQLPSGADVAALAELPRTQTHTQVFVGGPGWDPDDLPDRVWLLGSLQQAEDELSAAAGR